MQRSLSLLEIIVGLCLVRLWATQKYPFATLQNVICYTSQNVYLSAHIFFINPKFLIA